MVMFSISNKHEGVREKDSLKNVEATKEFVCNIATWDLREQVNLSSGEFQSHENEIEITGLETVPSRLVKPPRIKASPIHLECKYYKSIQLPVKNEQYSNRMILGEVIGIHIADEVLVNGKVDISKVKPIARLGYFDFAVVLETFEMPRPKI
jgi:flavin reductase (DIM6/NTAB) family NADH-FMN oxidoreductase RutF